MKINERSKFIINELIKRNTYVTASEIADLLQVSIKTVTRQLVNVEKILNENDLILERKTSKGMQIIGTEEQRQKMLEQIQSNGLHEYSPVERQNIVLSHLLKSQEPIKLLTLAKLLNVTEATISNDLDKLETWIKKMNMNLVRKPGLGIYLEGLEKDIRKAIISHIKRVHLPVPQGLFHVDDKVKVDRRIGKTFLLRQCVKIVVAHVSVQKADAQTVIGGVNLLDDTGVVAAHRQHTLVAADGAGKVEFFFAFRRFAGRCAYVDLAVFQHLLHIAPAFVVADILVLDVPIPRHQAEKIIAVAAFSAVLIHHVVTVHCKKNRL